MAELDSLYTALRNADKAGDTAAAQKIAGFIRQQQSAPPKQDFATLPLDQKVDAIPGMGKIGPAAPAKKEPSFGDTLNQFAGKALATFTPMGQLTMARVAPAKTLDKALSVPDTALSLGANAVAAPVAAAGGVMRSLFGGKYGTKEGAQQAEDFASRLQKAAYQPRTEAGKEILAKFSKMMEGVPAYVPVAGPMAPLGKAAGAQAGMRAGELAADATERAAGLIPRKPSQMVGVGAAETEQALQRKTEARSLPVPIPLTKGQQTREHGQVRFERETAKDPQLGKPLRERFSEQNEALQKNLGAFDEATGSEQRSLRGVGQSVLDALAEKDAVKSKAINAAYQKARASGQMKEPVPVKALMDYVQDNRSSAKNAPIISAVQSEIKRLTKGKNDVLTIDQMEELRKFINKTMNEAGPDVKFGPEMKKIIDQTTEGKGGDLYRQARRMAENHKREFEDRQVIRNLMDMRKGDRRVAVEDVFNRSVMGGSLDDVRHLRRVLQTSGPKGEQAWKELQGATVRHMQEAVTASAKLDEKGNPVVSADKLNKLVNELDADGRLEFMFGKKGADQIRTLNEVSKVVLTTPEGTVNHSNTGSVVASALADSLGDLIPGHHGPMFSAANWARISYKNRKTANRVRDALDEPIPEKP